MRRICGATLGTVVKRLAFWQDTLLKFSPPCHGLTTGHIPFEQTRERPEQIGQRGQQYYVSVTRSLEHAEEQYASCDYSKNPNLDWEDEKQVEFHAGEQGGKSKKQLRV
jgi:hypothetical protein